MKKQMFAAALMLAAGSAYGQNGRPLSSEEKADAMESAANTVRSVEASVEKEISSVKSLFIKARATKGVKPAVVAKLQASQQAFWAYYNSQVLSMESYSDPDITPVRLQLLSDRKKILTGWMAANNWSVGEIRSGKISDLPARQ